MDQCQRRQSTAAKAPQHSMRRRAARHTAAHARRATQDSPVRSAEATALTTVRLVRALVTLFCDWRANGRGRERVCGERGARGCRCQMFSSLALWCLPPTHTPLRSPALSCRARRECNHLTRRCVCALVDLAIRLLMAAKFSSP